MTAKPPSKGGRPCSVCAHRSRKEIDKRLQGGESPETISKGFELSQQSVYRHKINHLPMVMASGIERVSIISIPPGERQMALHGSEIVDMARSGKATAERLMAEAEEALELAKKGGDLPSMLDAVRTAIVALKEGRGHLELEAKLRGELASGVTLSVALGHPAVASRLDAIARVLARHPDVNAEVLAELEADRVASARRLG